MKEEIYHFKQKDESKELITLSMCGITFPDKNYRIDRSESRTSCIEYIKEGSGSVNVDGAVFYPSAGDSYFLKQGRSHHYFSDKERPWKKYFINFSGKLAIALTEAYGLSEANHFEGLDLEQELLDIIEIGKKEGDRTHEVTRILFEIFLKMYLHSHSAGLGSRYSIEEKMKDFLDLKATEKFSIEQLCKHVSRSESQTIRIFKKAYGTTPYNYVLIKKLELAKRLLRDTNLSVKEIADKLCFADEYYFSNIFKQKLGLTPSAYRKKNA